MTANRPARAALKTLVWVAAALLPLEPLPLFACHCRQCGTSENGCCCSAQNVSEGTCCCCANRHSETQPPACCHRSEPPARPCCGAKRAENASPGACNCGPTCPCHQHEPSPAPAVPTNSRDLGSDELNPGLSAPLCDAADAQPTRRPVHETSATLLSADALACCTLLCRFTL